MPGSRLRFGEYTLDIGNRSLRRGDEAVALNSRYFDALVLLASEPGRLIPKQRFFDEVWAGSVVTDAALTQCIKEIRRQLGDDAGDPRFVRTVPGHGYSFIAAVSEDPSAALDAGRDVAPAAIAVPAGEAPGGPAHFQPAMPDARAPGIPRWLVDSVAATLGGGVAGLTGGLLYGSALAWSPQAQSLGTLSVLLVLLALCVAVGMAGALGVGLGLAWGRRIGGRGAALLGATLGGMTVGGLTRLLGSDAFTLLVGQAPAGITGGLEGAAIGFAVAGGWLLGGGLSGTSGNRPIALAASAAGLAGTLIALAGGSMMAQSLARVAAAFEQSRLDMAPLARLFGEPQFGPLAQAALCTLEGALFGACVAGALQLAARRA